MKTLAEIDKTLHDFEKKFGISARGMQQQSEAWFNVKLGVISMSNVHKAVAGKKTDKRDGYMAFLVAQVCTGVMDELNFKQMEWGKQQEVAARSARQFASGEKFTEIGFVFKDDKHRIGCSPDCVTPTMPEEIKSPWDSTKYIQFLVGEKQKPEWVWQNQGTMWVMDAAAMNVTYFDPRMKTKPIHSIVVEKDPDYQTQLNETIPEFIEDMDKMLAKIGISFGEQWLRIAKKMEVA